MLYAFPPLGRAAVCGEPDGAAAAHHGHRHHRRQPQLSQQQPGRQNHQAQKVIDDQTPAPSLKLSNFPSSWMFNLVLNVSFKWKTDIISLSFSLLLAIRNGRL